MSTNGARKTPAASGNKKGNGGMVDESIYKSTFSAADRKAVKVKVRKPSKIQSNPGNWKKDNEVTVVNPIDAPPSPDSPLVNHLDGIIASAFPTNRPLEEKQDVVQCKHCKRPVARPMSAAHIKECLTKKQEKLKKKKEAKEAKDAAARKEKGGDVVDDDTSIKGARKTALKGSIEDSDKKVKKRKADDPQDKVAKKKKKDEPKAKTAKPKGPVDVERQCGVPLPNGGQCARSLTCKSHSMGLKRAVPGRSLPYDILLANYQKKNQAKQQRAAIEANAPLFDEDSAQGPIDSDEEKESIMAAVARSKPQPMVIRPLISTRAKYQHIRMKEMLRTALGASPRNANGIFTNHSLTNPSLSSHVPAPIDTNIAARHHGSMLGSAALTSAGLDGGGLGFSSPAMSNFGDASERRQSSISGQPGGPRTILPGQLPGPGSRKQSMVS